MSAERNLAGLGGLRRSVIAMITVFAVLAATVIGVRGPITASAAQANVTVKNFKIDPTSNVKPGDVVNLGFDWEVSGEVNPGDEFTVEFPEAFPVAGIDFALEGDKGKGGDCTATRTKVTCRFTEAYSGKDNVGGNIELEAQAQATETVSHEFKTTANVEGFATVQLDGPIQPADPGETEEGPKDPTEFRRDKFAKGGWIDKFGDPKIINWYIDVPASELEGVDEITITDTIPSGDAHEHFDGEGQWRDAYILPWADSLDRNANNIPKAFESYKVDNGGKTLNITIKKPDEGWHPAGTYQEAALRVEYKTRFTGTGNPANGQVFKNGVELVKEQPKTADGAVTYTAKATGTIRGTDRGTFALKKIVDKQGEFALCDDPENSSYEVEVTIEVPDANSDFAFTETLKEKPDAKREGTKIIYTESISVGDEIRGYDKLPAGSKVSLRETKKPEIDGVVFETESFDTTLPIEIQGPESDNTQVTLTNPAKCEKTAQPTTSLSSTTAPESTSETTAPESTSETTAPESTSETTAPESTSETTAPESTSETTAPESTSETTAPESSESTTSNVPVVPSVTTSESTEPTTSKSTGEPTPSDSSTTSTTTSNVPVVPSVTTSKSTEPTTSKSTAPVTTSKTTEPSSSKTTDPSSSETTESTTSKSSVPGGVVSSTPTVTVTKTVEVKQPCPSCSPTTVTQPVPGPTVTQPGVTTTVTTTVTSPAPTPGVIPTPPSQGSASGLYCIDNAIRSPLLYLVPLMILGNIGGKYAAPYIAEYQAQLNELNAEINRRIQEQIKVPDLGIGQNLPRFENEQYNEFVARVNQANAELQRMASRPEVQQLGQVAGLILAVGAASAVLYDWCTNEPGKAVTAVGGDGSSARGVVVPGTNGVAGVRVG